MLLVGCGGTKNNPDDLGNNPTSSTSAVSFSSAIESSVYSSVQQSSSLSSTNVSSAVSSNAQSSSSIAQGNAALECGQNIGAINNNNLNSDAKAHLLCLHNKTRSEVATGKFPGLYGNLQPATNMKRLRWDNKLAQVAQNWANQCQWQHNPNRQSQYNALSPSDIDGAPLRTVESVGENIAYYSSTSMSKADVRFAIDGYNLWKDEGYEYSFGKLAVSDHCDAAMCGHFTQIIWASTYKVGCAVNFCPARTLSNYPSTYLVCNYASAGNYINNEPYRTGNSSADICSQPSPLNQTICRHGLTESAHYTNGL